MTTILDGLATRVRLAGDNPALNQRAGSWSWIGQRASSGASVSDDEALALTAVYRCVSLIATRVAGLPIHVFEERGIKPDGDATDAITVKLKSNDTAYLWRRPNLEMSRQTFWETVVGHEILGDAFIWVDKTDTGAPFAIWYIEPERVRVGRLRRDVGQLPAGTKIYEIDGDLPMVDYVQGGEIIHVPNWGRRSLRGINPIKIAAEAIGLGLTAEQYAARFFTQDSTPNGLLSTDQTLNDVSADRLARRWDARNAGLANAHRTAVLYNGLKFQQIQVNPADAQLLEERKFQVTEIARLFGLPPHLVADVEKSTSWGAGIEEQGRALITYTLEAHINRFEQAITDALLNGELTNRYARFDLGALLRGTLLQRYQAYALGFGRWLTANKILKLEDEAPVDGGDVLLVNAAMTPAELVAAGVNTAAPLGGGTADTRGSGPNQSAPQNN